MNIPEFYHEITLWISRTTGLSDPILHIHAGLVVLLTARLICARSLGTFIPFFFVILAEATNEILDYMAYGWRQADTYLDIANTLFWPLVISLVVRLRPVPRRDHR
ncbi:MULTISPECIES: hypothetical protein [Sphingomonadales]|uniref:VanZ-like domain-containing protein n=2 Tax=Sphingomonadaceae TaxID=41297 RepID=A0A0J7XHR1_9SPHN|nr:MULTISPECIES: hypothetical protein [Sphingomonadaceae]KMS50688.1 hypothetical protein V474_06205 [Novosphingobium barchaimii LL02]MBB4151089.1 hypothetical protein [Sphingobium scionense]